jgi:GNAT superfamily N-acetyltransferase
VADLGGVTVRAARPAEHAAIGELCVAAYRAAGVAVARYEPTLRDVDGRAAGADVLVAQDGDDRLLGTVTFVLGGPLREIAGEDEAEFRMLAVDPSAGGRGIGTTLVRECADRARARGGEKPGEQHPGARADPRRDADPVPLPHARPV